MPTDRPKIRHAVRLFVAPLLTLALCGCVTESREVQPTPGTDAQTGLPREVLRVPQQMQDLSGDLLRYHAKYHTLPPSIAVLVDEDLMSAQRYAELPDYLYSPMDKYKLRDGRTVILVDSAVRVEGHAWCIVREPVAQPRSIQLNVTPIALSQLEAAAQRAK